MRGFPLRGFASKWFPPLPAALGAVVSGLLLAVAFPPFSVGPLSFVALVPLFVALHRRATTPRVFFKSGYLFGCAFFTAHMWWVVCLSPASSITVPWLMVPATAALILYLALYPALWIWLVGWLGRGRVIPLVLLAPSLWIVVEWIRSSGAFGFPWGSIGYALVHHPSMTQSAAVVGVLGLGALIVLVNALWASAVLIRGIMAKVVFLSAGLAVVVSNIVVGRIAIDRFHAVTPDKQFRVVLVQPNVDLALKWDPAFTDSIFVLIGEQATEAAASRPDLVVFPETAAPTYLRYSLQYKSVLRELAATLGTDIFIGFLDARYDGPGGAVNLYNSSGLFGSNGDFAQYDKEHLLPFGETIPYAWKFRVLQKINFGQANFQPGPDTPPIRSSAGGLAPLICFEAAFPNLARKEVRRGADIIVNITNDGWFGATPGPYQHSDMSILRAVENRRFLIRSANTGVTMIVDPVGRVTHGLPMDKKDVLVGEVYHVDEKTFYTRHGDRPVVVAALAVVFLGFIARPLFPPGRTRRGK
jgi:apolipoprotein N-acyltransferase